MISFNIENIKISDLNSFGTKDKNNKNAKWKNISISNQYLYSKLTLLVKNGMYYQNKENIVFENNHNDFKVSINYQKLLDFLNQILTKQTNNKARTR